MFVCDVCVVVVGFKNDNFLCCFYVIFGCIGIVFWREIDEWK